MGHFMVPGILLGDLVIQLVGFCQTLIGTLFSLSHSLFCRYKSSAVRIDWYVHRFMTGLLG